MMVIMSRISLYPIKTMAISFFQSSKNKNPHDSKHQSTTRNNLMYAILNSLDTIEKLRVSQMSFLCKKVLHQQKVAALDCSLKNLKKVLLASCLISKALLHQETFQGLVRIDASLSVFMVHQVMRDQRARCNSSKTLTTAQQNLRI